MSCVVLLLYEKKHKKQKMQMYLRGPGSSVKLDRVYITLHVVEGLAPRFGHALVVC